MTIVFRTMPNAYRVPGGHAEIDGSRAVGAQAADPHRVLMIGIQSGSGASAAQGDINQILGEEDGDALHNSRSILAAAARAFKRVNRTALLFTLAMLENAAGTAAAGTFPFTGTATEDKTLTARIGDTRVSVLVASGTTAAVAAAALVAQVALTDRCPMSASLATATVTCTARHKGTSGNALTLELESLPAGLTCTPVQPTGGATNPSMATAIGFMDDVRYDTIVVVGFEDATNMGLIEDEMERRWGPLVKQPGHVWAATRGTHGTLTTYGSARNSQFSSVVGSGLSPTPPWIWAAQAAGVDAIVCDTMPNRPRNGRRLRDCEAPKKSDRFDDEQRNLLLYDGISTYKVDQSGKVLSERFITTYQTNVAGNSDVTYLSIETVRNLGRMYVECLNLAGKYPDFVLVPDGTNVDPGVPALSPGQYAGELSALNRGWERKGRSKDAEGFDAELICEINEENVERLDVEIHPRLVNGLVTIAHKLAFQL